MLQKGRNSVFFFFNLKDNFIVFLFRFFRRTSQVPVYHCSSGQLNPIKWNLFGFHIRENIIKYPTKFMVLYPNPIQGSNFIVHRFYDIFYHFLPAVFYDVLMRLQGMKPSMVKIAKRSINGMQTVCFFCLNEWIFDSTNSKKLIDEVAACSDNKDFPLDIREINWEKYLYAYIYGIRKFMFKEDESDLPKARSKMYW